MQLTFICQKCGVCCTDKTNKTKISKKPEFIKEKLINITPISLGLFDWETKKFSECKNKPQIANLTYDIKNNTSIITHYTYSKYPQCFFQTEQKNCGIYENRPIICRMWPCPYGKYLPRQPKSSSKICKAEIPLNELNKILEINKVDFNQQLTPEFFQKNLFKRYNEAFLYRHLFDLINEKIFNFLEEQTKKKNLKPAKKGYNTQFLLRKIKKNPMINFSEYYKKFTGNNFELEIKHEFENIQKRFRKKVQPIIVKK